MQLFSLRRGSLGALAWKALASQSNSLFIISFYKLLVFKVFLFLTRALFQYGLLQSGQFLGGVGLLGNQEYPHREHTNF